MFDDFTLSDFDDCALSQNPELLTSVQKSISLSAIPYLHESEQYNDTRLGLF